MAIGPFSNVRRGNLRSDDNDIAVSLFPTSKASKLEQNTNATKTAAAGDQLTGSGCEPVNEQ